ncbi:MAG: phosphotransferase [Alicyclobacillus sp.]|nr:phosphotransferase [Alicyclobacillus sp.]
MAPPQSQRMPESAVTAWRAAVAAAYGLRLRAVVRRRSVWGLIEEDGQKWIWKPVTVPADVAEPRLVVVARLAERLKPAGVVVAAPVMNRYGAFVSVCAEQTGYLQPWLDGRHAQYANRQERLAAIATVAALHRALPVATLFDSAVLYRGSLREKLRRKARFLQQSWPVIADRLPEVRGLWARLQAAAAEAVRAAWSSQPLWPSLRSEHPPLMAYCHRDLAPHNVLWQGGPSLALLDFDQAGLDDPLGDVLQICNHTLFLAGAQPGLLRETVAVYQRTAGLTLERAEVLWLLLRFPDVWVRVASEWLEAGCPEAGRARVLYAAACEQARWQLWAEEHAAQH